MMLTRQLPRLLARHERFASGKTSAQGEFTSLEQVKSLGVPTKGCAFCGGAGP